MDDDWGCPFFRETSHDLPKTYHDLFQCESRRPTHPVSAVSADCGLQPAINVKMALNDLDDDWG